MSKSKESFNKKEKEKLRAKKRKEKEEKMEERRNNASKGKSLDDMLAYIDENGNISSTPPDPSKMVSINYEDIQLGAAPVRDDLQDELHTGTLESFFEDKGFGFIRDARSADTVFVHINNMSEDIAKGDKVTFQTEKTARGLNATDVKKAS